MGFGEEAVDEDYEGGGGSGRVEEGAGEGGGGGGGETDLLVYEGHGGVESGG